MPVVGVIGGGQLARMMIPAALGLGIELRVLAELSRFDLTGSTTAKIALANLTYNFKRLAWIEGRTAPA